MSSTKPVWDKDWGHSVPLNREHLRILHLERLEVEYKSVKSLTTREGTCHHVSKKDFCRLLKTATLMTLEEIQKSWYH